MASELAAYLRTRIATPRIGLLWLVVIAACLASGTSIDGPRSGFTVALLALLIAQFRLWDDLQDLAHDRAHHPERVLVRTARLAPFRFLLALSFAAGLGALTMGEGATRGVVYLLLVAAFVALYLFIRSRKVSRLLRNQLVLIKYPAFVSMFAPDPLHPRALAAAILLYLLLSAYDARDGNSR